ncbi:EAL domain-containing protein [Mesorhizobium sp. NPDC059054]|uniref:EAL domain-containing protein n=1 Tax=Mesorhizobium sp. NPDC059054 TaxID=3346711 RepID=UPI0036AFE551
MAAFYMSWTIVETRKQTQLLDIANYALARTQATFSEAANALEMAERLTEPSCSAAHVAALRAIVVNTRSVEDIGFFDNGTLQCNSWGKPTAPVLRSPIDVTTSNGMGVTASLRPLISGGTPLTGFHFGAYVALTNPGRFTDVPMDKEVKLAVLAGGSQAVVGTRHDPDLQLLQKLADGAKPESNERTLYGIARDRDWTVVAVSPTADVFQDLGDDLPMPLAVGAATSLLMVGLVVWLSRRRLSLLGELATAIRRREFIVHYQPIIDMKTGACVGAETLVRWQRPNGETVRPDIFIPLAEENGLIEAITHQVIEIAIAELKDLLVADRSLHIAINLSAEDIKSGSFLPYMAALLEATDIRAQQLWLEATERGFMDSKLARVTLEKARREGHSVAIDDFGTGYSSLQYLQDLPLDALKIDKSFIDMIGMDAAASAITPHIIDIAKSLGLFIVAEGVERQEQADYLSQRGVHYAQGWLFSKALPKSEFIEFYQRCRQSKGPGPEVIRFGDGNTSPDP